MLQIEPFDLQGISQVAQRLIQACQTSPVWLFEGQMGAGKTTLIKAICQHLGVVNTVQSPTFSIVNEYLTTSGEAIYHFDCYRLKNTAEAYDIGLEEYLDSGNLCLIEWPDKIADLLPDRFVTISIKETMNGKREIIVTDNNTDTND
ncbi:tRNA (adenosine(37)-N6)-threonylcarbamoyltransferase complex ATPase subunit type 1 TsaE [Runella rosea]|uniref:tRNA threonylcarbamoyladenosine biosynthesis protein TsaE n=1 Tax=Runella rosea TaxID=2259595 RepID=A0A344TF52_9BACT|nr:tRNA (adenosine(37)-N6)-threonylcarbamoyltransferase complex ATPase subunit type 1 TsaE [Runella rosea]AXE17273.1 tRNA (adenosine(37)-N6)-threonylcarbamoyltransferase complex ATPase subunit type 1 TsaE [Runella rosea]